MPNETQSEIANPMGYVTREDARKLEAGIADCMLIMRDQTGRFERPVYARPEKKGSEMKGFGCPVPTSAARAGRIYVAGPMSGIAEFNFPVFNAAAAILRCQGWVVENPAEHSLAEGLVWADYMAYDLTRLGLCGAIYMLPGWSKSKGATIEKNLAEALGMNIQFDPNAEQAIDTAPTLPSGEQMEFDRLAHEQVIAVCRAAAFNCSEQHSYMAGLKNDYKNWFPHKWVIDAMRALIGVNQSTCSDLRAHVTRLQARNAALQLLLNVADQMSDEAVTLIRELYNSKGPALTYRFMVGVEEFFAKHFPQ